MTGVHAQRSVKITSGQSGFLLGGVEHNAFPLGSVLSAFSDRTNERHGGAQH
jgi:hypothetical protein